MLLVLLCTVEESGFMLEGCFFELIRLVVDVKRIVVEVDENSFDGAVARLKEIVV